MKRFYINGLTVSAANFYSRLNAFTGAVGEKHDRIVDELLRGWTYQVILPLLRNSTTFKIKEE